MLIKEKQIIVDNLQSLSHQYASFVWDNSRIAASESPSQSNEDSGQKLTFSDILMTLCTLHF